MKKKLKKNIKKILKLIIVTTCMMNVFIGSAFASSGGNSNALSGVLQPLDLLKTLVLAIVAGVGVVYLVKNAMEFFVAWQQTDQHTMSTALKGMVGGFALAGISGIIAFLGF